MKWQITASKNMATAEANIQKKIQTGKKTSEGNLEEYVEILDGNADAKREKIKTEQIKLSSEEDLESLLKLAEKLKEKVDILELEIKSYQNQLAFGYLLFGLTFFLALFTPYFLNSFMPDFKDNNLLFYLPRVLSFSLLSFILVNLVWNFFGKKKISDKKRIFASEKLALREVMQLLREIHGTIAEREDWSILKRAEFRIRLSRFDLSEKKDSVFSFFS